jgi:hypothetical protein
MGPYEWIGLFLVCASVVLLASGIRGRRDGDRPKLHHALFASHLAHRVFFRDDSELFRRPR